jgi:hypothetical protein
MMVEMLSYIVGIPWHEMDQIWHGRAERVARKPKQKSAYFIDKPDEPAQGCLYMYANRICESKILWRVLRSLNFIQCIILFKV